MSYKSTTYLKLFCILALFSSVVYGEQPKTNRLAENGVFIQIPGPNPILKPGPRGSWDDNILEASDAYEEYGTYYIYYHGSKGAYYGDSGVGEGKGYQIGVASSSHPLGPFKKPTNKPVLEIGPEGSWEDRDLACAMILKDGNKKYLMFYFGRRRGRDGMGLATASHPLGPWTKYEGNPIIEDFGYTGGVVKVDDTYYLYSEYPISMRKPDYGPMAVATAKKPEGPWTKYEGNPVMDVGQWGEWDGGGISEAEVLYNNGVFHMFYGGTPMFDPSIGIEEGRAWQARDEDIGYAYSFDGFKWFKYGMNPVVTRHDCPNISSFSEVHTVMKAPFIYLYNTQRYKKVDGIDYPWIEHLGVQVLVTQRPFQLDMPLLSVNALAAGRTTPLADVPPVSLSHIRRLAITAQCTYSKNASGGLRLHVVSSPDGIIYDTLDYLTVNVKALPGQQVRKTFVVDPAVRFIKVLAENMDASEPLADLKITATLGG
ncbi:hypothetical protein ACFL1G_00860 [Planctomycetota bacterium]